MASEIKAGARLNVVAYSKFLAHKEDEMLLIKVQPNL